MSIAKPFDYPVSDHRKGVKMGSCTRGVSNSRRHQLLLYFRTGYFPMTDSDKQKKKQNIPNHVYYGDRKLSLKPKFVNPTLAKVALRTIPRPLATGRRTTPRRPAAQPTTRDMDRPTTRDMDRPTTCRQRRLSETFTFSF